MSKEAMKLALEALEMVDDEGENRAVRMFLALYGGQYGVTAEQMRKHLSMSGFDGAWPEWANTHNGHLTKAGAQLWIRHLFSLEQPAQQEPVAWMVYTLDGKSVYVTDNPADFTVEHRSLPLYTSPPAEPPRRQWAELNHEDIHALMNEFFYSGMQPSAAHFANFARAIEAKLKEKNT